VVPAVAHLTVAADDADHDEVWRRQLAGLVESGLKTEWRQRAYTSEQVNQIVARLRQIPREDYASKLKVAGFTATPYHPPEGVELEQSCSTCMYFERHREFCNLPELALPVRPEWSCVLWRI